MKKVLQQLRFIMVERERIRRRRKMAKTIDNEEFRRYCRGMFDANCKERREHRQKLYNSFEKYYRTNTDWLYRKFSKRKGNT